MNPITLATSRVRAWRAEGMPLPGSGTVGARDRKRWRAAATLDDLCALSAGWLAGEIRTQPGYYGSVDVDEPDAPGLTETLIALNRAGFLTRSSQAGYFVDGSAWTQRAAVEGFTTEQLAGQLRKALEGSRFRILTGSTRRAFTSKQGVAVSYANGRPFTCFGSARSAHEIAFDFTGVGRSAVDAVQASVQVTIWDPRVGSNDLWPFLRAIAATLNSAPVPDRQEDVLARITRPGRALPDLGLVADGGLAMGGDER